MADASIGYGQATPWDFSHPTNAFAFSVRQMMARMETNRLVQIKAVHYAGSGAGAIAKAGTVDVLPLVNQIDGQNNSTPHGTVYGVPWFRLQGGLNAVIVDPQVGDVGYVAVEARDISIVKRAGKQSNPGSFRMFDLADGIYVGGLLNAVPTQYLAFADHKIDLVDDGGNHLAFSSGGIDLTPAASQDVTVHGPAIVTGNFTAQGAAALNGTVTAGGEVDIVGPLVVAGGATIKRVLTGSVTTNFGGTIAAGNAATVTTTVTGAKVGDFVVLGMSNGQGATINLTTFVSSLNTVTINAGNASTGAVSVSTVTYNVLVIGIT